jgi:hypothetical protein
MWETVNKIWKHKPKAWGSIFDAYGYQMTAIELTVKTAEVLAEEAGTLMEIRKVVIPGKTLRVVISKTYGCTPMLSD